MKISKNKISEIINQVLKENNSRLRGTMLDFNPAAGFTSEEWYRRYNPEGPPTASPAALARMGLKDPSIPEGPGGHSGESEGLGVGEGEDPEPQEILDYAIEMVGGLEGLKDLPPEDYNKIAQYVIDRDANKSVEKGFRDAEEAGHDEFLRQRLEQEEEEKRRKAIDIHRDQFSPAALQESKSTKLIKNRKNKMRINEDKINKIIQNAIQNALNKLEEQAPPVLNNAADDALKNITTAAAATPATPAATPGAAATGTTTTTPPVTPAGTTTPTPTLGTTTPAATPPPPAAKRDDKLNEEDLEEQAAGIRGRASSAFDELDASPSPTATTPKATTGAGSAKPAAGGGDFGRPGALGKRRAPTATSPRKQGQTQPRPGSLGARTQQRRRDRASQGLGMTSTEKRVDKTVKEELEEGSAGFHACAAHVKENATGREGRPINHTLLEDGTVTHYTVEFENEIVEGIPSNKLTVLEENVHLHGKRDDKKHDKKKKRVKHEENVEDEQVLKEWYDSSLFDKLTKKYTGKTND